MSKPSSPRSPQSPKDAKSGGEKQTLNLGELMQRLDGAVDKTIEDYSDLFVTNFKEQRSVLEDCRDYIDKLGRENATIAENFRRRDEEAFALQEVQTEEIAEKKARIEDLEAQLAQCLAYKEVDNKPEEFMLKVKEDIGNRVSYRVKEVLAQIEILQSEIYMYASSTTGLQEEVDRLKAENRRLRGDIDLKGQAEELQIKRSRHQRHVIRHNDRKIQILGKSLQQVIRQFCEERRILEEKHAYLVAEFMADKVKLKSIVLQKAQELKKFRHLAETVIRQRGEVELFLLDSIQYVKNQIYMQKKIQSYHTAENADALHGNVSNLNCPSLDSSSAWGSTLPPIHKAPASCPGARPWPRFKHPEIHDQNNNNNNNNNNNKGVLINDIIMTQAQAEVQINYLDSSHDPFTVPAILPMIDISELSWEGREKVLRYLFKKINTARNNQLQAEPAERTQAMQVEQEKYQGDATEAARTIV